MIALVHSADRPAVSRDFLVGQAVRNALAENYPFGLRNYGVTAVARRLAEHGVPDYFAESVTDEFRKLTGAYSETASEESDLEWVGFSGANWP